MPAPVKSSVRDPKKCLAYACCSHGHLKVLNNQGPPIQGDSDNEDTPEEKETHIYGVPHWKLRTLTPASRRAGRLHEPLAAPELRQSQLLGYLSGSGLAEAQRDGSWEGRLGSASSGCKASGKSSAVAPFLHHLVFASGVLFVGEDQQRGLQSGSPRVCTYSACKAAARRKETQGCKAPSCLKLLGPARAPDPSACAKAPGAQLENPCKPHYPELQTHGPERCRILGPIAPRSLTSLLLIKSFLLDATADAGM